MGTTPTSALHNLARQQRRQHDVPLHSGRRGQGATSSLEPTGPGRGSLEVAGVRGPAALGPQAGLCPSKHLSLARSHGKGDSRLQPPVHLCPHALWPTPPSPRHKFLSWHASRKYRHRGFGAPDRLDWGKSHGPDWGCGSRAAQGPVVATGLPLSQEHGGRGTSKGAGRPQRHGQGLFHSPQACPRRHSV